MSSISIVRSSEAQLASKHGADLAGDWGRMHASLAAWKVQRLLAQVRSEVRQLHGDQDIDPASMAAFSEVDRLMRQATAAIAAADAEM